MFFGIVQYFQMANNISDVIIFVFGNSSAFSYDSDVVDEFSFFCEDLSSVEDKNVDFVLEVVELLR